MSSSVCAAQLRAPSACKPLRAQWAHGVQRPAQCRVVCRSASRSSAPAAQPMLTCCRTGSQLGQHGDRRGDATVCSARKPAVPTGKMEEAAAVASSTYHGLPIFWQVLQTVSQDWMCSRPVPDDVGAMCNTAVPTSHACCAADHLNRLSDVCSLIRPRSGFLASPPWRSSQATSSWASSTGRRATSAM